MSIIALTFGNVIVKCKSTAMKDMVLTLAKLINIVGKLYGMFKVVRLLYQVAIDKYFMSGSYNTCFIIIKKIPDK